LRKLAVSLLAGIALVVFGSIVVFLVGMRTKYPPVTDAVRKFNRKVTKPRAMESAGQPGAYAAIIRHVGRSSGIEYETPIGPFETDKGFVVPLPYGTTADWVKNVLRAGTAIIDFEGETYDVDQPVIIGPDDAMDAIPPKYQRSLRWFNVKDFLEVRRIDS
jgi:hypothetical protein